MRHIGRDSETLDTTVLHHYGRLTSAEQAELTRRVASQVIEPSVKALLG